MHGSRFFMKAALLSVGCVIFSPAYSAGGFAPPGYTAETGSGNTGSYYPNTAPAQIPSYPQYNQAYPTQPPAPAYGYNQNPNYGGYSNPYGNQGYGGYAQPLMPSYQLPPGYNYSMPQQPYGYGYPQYGQNYYNQYRPAPRPMPRRPVEDEPFSLIPWDHFPGGGMPDFNPFSQGPTKGLPSKMFNTPMKDWAVEEFGDVWEDALNAPHDMGRLPGNFQAPSVSIPNPIDLGDQVGDASATASEEAPEVIQGWFD